MFAAVKKFFQPKDTAVSEDEVQQWTNQNELTPDIWQLEQYARQLIFVPDDCREGYANHQLVREGAYMDRAVHPTCFTAQRFHFFIKDLGSGSFPIPLPEDYEPSNFLQWPVETARVKGELWAIRPRQFIYLDKHKQHGVQFRRQRVQITLPYREVKYDSKSPLPHITDDYLCTRTAWMYIGIPKYWDDQIGGIFKSCQVDTKEFETPKKFIDKFYEFDNPDPPRSKSKIIEQHIPCPVCPSSDAFCIYDDGHGYCFSCDHYKPKEGSISDDSYTYEYLPHRGITKEVFSFYDTKTKIDAEGKPVSVGFTYPNGAVKVRTLPKGFHSVGDMSKAGLFGRNKFGPGSHKSVTITEGELDALSLYQTCRNPVVSVRSSSSAKLDCSIDRSFLNSFERIYIAFDGDEPGRSAAAEVAKLFDYNKVYDVRFPGGDRKDANDYLRNGEESELRQLWYNAKKFLPDNLMSSQADFEKELLKPVQNGISYPFPTLTNMTYGLRTGEVVLLTAQEGVGKTEVMHTILHHLLKETKDAVGAIFLEESKQRLLQAIAGIELKKPVHLPDSGCQPSEVVAALKQVVPTDDRLYIYNHFGSDDADSLLDTIRFLVTARGCRWIFFDLISLAVTGLGGEREREALEYLSARLEILTQELDFGLIMVSHVNDYGQTRGSRMISKNCHIRVDLTRDVSSASDRSRLTTTMVVSKNRPTSRTGPAGQLLFDPITHTLSEDFGLPANDNQTLDNMAEAA